MESLCNWKAHSSGSSNTLYPRLQDHDLVKKYPHVRGFAKDVYFLTHSHKENGGAEESTSKYNTFEVCKGALVQMYSTNTF